MPTRTYHLYPRLGSICRADPFLGSIEYFQYRQHFSSENHPAWHLPLAVARKELAKRWDWNARPGVINSMDRWLIWSTDTVRG